jgi:hypothetical protein
MLRSGPNSSARNAAAQLHPLLLHKLHFLQPISELLLLLLLRLSLALEAASSSSSSSSPFLSLFLKPHFFNKPIRGGN